MRSAEQAVRLKGPAVLSKLLPLIFELPMNNVTRILSAAEQGDPAAAAELLPLVYQELRQLAAAKLTQERPGQTLDATGLVHEAYLRLVGPRTDKTWQNRRHFFAAAAEAMRRILIDNARRKKRLKHGGDLRRVDQGEIASSNAEPPDRLLAINDAISQLALADPEAVEVVKLAHFRRLFDRGSRRRVGDLSSNRLSSLDLCQGMAETRIARGGRYRQGSR